MEQDVGYTYWKKPWHKWVVLIAAVLQTISLCLGIRDFREISRSEIRDKLFSPMGWERYAADQYVQYAIGILLICGYLGVFIIGLFARSKKAACRFEGVLLISITLILGIAGVVIPVFSDQGNTVIWLFALITSFCASIYSLWQSRKS